MNKEAAMSDSTDRLLGCIRISTEGEYHPGKYTIETFGYWNQDKPSWGMPDWVERGWSEFAGHFESYAAAEKAIADSWWNPEWMA